MITYMFFPVEGSDLALLGHSRGGYPGSQSYLPQSPPSLHHFHFLLALGVCQLEFKR
jgi:hypothetical protein